jgi:hypothetical protein
MNSPARRWKRRAVANRSAGIPPMPPCRPHLDYVPAKRSATLEPWLSRVSDVTFRSEWTETLQEMKHGRRYEGWNDGGTQKANR